jgi:hypothetical protein
MYMIFQGISMRSFEAKQQRSRMSSEDWNTRFVVRQVQEPLDPHEPPEILGLSKDDRVERGRSRWQRQDGYVVSYAIITWPRRGPGRSLSEF